MFASNQQTMGMGQGKNRNANQKLAYETDGEKSDVPRYIGNWGIESGAEEYLGMNHQMMMGYMSTASVDDNSRMAKQKREAGRQAMAQNATKGFESDNYQKPAENQQEAGYNMLNAADLMSFLQ